MRVFLVLGILFLMIFSCKKDHFKADFSVHNQTGDTLVVEYLLGESTALQSDTFLDQEIKIIHFQHGYFKADLDCRKKQGLSAIQIQRIFTLDNQNIKLYKSNANDCEKWAVGRDGVYHTLILRILEEDFE